MAQLLSEELEAIYLRVSHWFRVGRRGPSCKISVAGHKWTDFLYISSWPQINGRTDFLVQCDVVKCFDRISHEKNQLFDQAEKGSNYAMEWWWSWQLNLPVDGFSHCTEHGLPTWQEECIFLVHRGSYRLHPIYSSSIATRHHHVYMSKALNFDL